MKFTHVGQLAMTLEFLQDMTANVQMQQAFASAMSPFIVIEARVNVVDNTLEQVIYDPSGLRLRRVIEGELLPRITVSIVKSVAASIHDNPFTATIVLP